jgi:hypothetical protein
MPATRPAGHASDRPRRASVTSMSDVTGSPPVRSDSGVKWERRPTSRDRPRRGNRHSGVSFVLHRIDFEHARVVADAFLDAPRSPASALVRAAYAELGDQADRWFAQLTDHRARTPVRVVFTRCREPYASGEELSTRVRSDGVLELCPAYFDRDRHHPLLDVSIGGTYDRFRAVHDIVSHARLGFSFDRHGEFSAWLAEDRMYTGLARWALATELHAEHSVLWTTATQAAHKGTLLPAGLVEASRGLRSDGSVAKRSSR